MLPWANPGLQSNRLLDRFSHFCAAHVRVSSGMSFGDSFPLKLSLRMGRPGSHLITLVPWAHPSPHNPNVGISIGSAVFAGLAPVTDRQTDDGTRSVTIGRIYVRRLLHHSLYFIVLLYVLFYCRMCTNVLSRFILLYYGTGTCIGIELYLAIELFSCKYVTIKLS